MKSPLLLIGAGRMGGALAKGWLAKGLGPVLAVDPKPAAKLKRLDGISFVPDISEVPAKKYRACVIALKPQVLKPNASAFRPVAESGVLMLSIAAGVNTRFLQKAWGRTARIVRAMPNTPGAIGAGITGLFAAKKAASKDLKLAETLLEALGKTVWVKRESLIDAVTAISGSGPAYVFALVEALAAAGVALGLKPAEAELLARATVVGSGALLAADPKPAAELRRDVTSPGGTTAAALEILLSPEGLTALMGRAAKAARDRSQELGA
jgi:pyrroline-5-carboxylate reductase